MTVWVSSGLSGKGRVTDRHRLSRAQNKGTSELDELQSKDRYHSGELQLMSCDWQQNPYVEQNAEDRYNLVKRILVSHVGTAKKDDGTCFISTLCDVTSQKQNQIRRMEAY